jgi:thymidylate kinase
MKLLVTLNKLIIETPKRDTTDEFIEKARKVHGDKYDYSEVDYQGSKKKVKIICTTHGIFLKTPNDHLSGVGCGDCTSEEKSKKQIKKSLEDFIQDARKVHGDKYDYSKVNYQGVGKKINIICPIHGSFPHQNPYNHLKGQGCPDCARELVREKLKRKNNEFIELAKKVHGDKYDYSEVNYQNKDKKVKIICSLHGPFSQSPHNHLKGSKCDKCANISRIEKIKDTKEIFIDKARKVHGDAYDYSKVDYQRSDLKVNIICKKHNFEFPMIPNSHLNGSGCPICNESKGEKYVANILDNRNITYVRWKRFNDCKGFCRTLSFDFYLPDYNMLIEYDGEQHFNSINYWGGDEKLKKIQIYDTIKNEYAKRNNIKLIRIPYTLPLKYVDDLLTTEIK